MATNPLYDALEFFEHRFDSLSRAFRERVGFDDAVRVVAFRGWGTRGEVKVRGRVLSDPEFKEGDEHPSLRNLAHMLHRYESDEVPGARVLVRCLGAEAEAKTNEEGFFEVTLAPERAPSPGELWVPVECELLEPITDHEDQRTSFHTEVQIPQQASFAILSDMDDTVIKTGVGHSSLVTLATVLLNSARSRLPLAGVPSFYRALARGGQGDGARNPFFYVSSSSWNIYELFEDFLEAREIPKGAFFLQELGLQSGRLFKDPHDSYKKEHIRTAFRAFPDLSFVLLGDSSQLDASIYAEICDEFPERVLAIYIRDVSEENEASVRALAERVERDHKVPMLFIEDTEAAAEHAASIGLIEQADLDAIRAETAEGSKKAQEGESSGLDAIREKLSSIFS